MLDSAERRPIGETSPPSGTPSDTPVIRESTTLSHDDKTGLIEIDMTGCFWTAAQMDQHFGEVERLAARVRSRFGRARIVVDISRTPPQAPDTADRIRIGVARVTRPGDRIAMLVGSSLAKIQLRRLVSDDTYQPFVSRQAALRWVMA